MPKQIAFVPQSHTQFNPVAKYDLIQSDSKGKRRKSRTEIGAEESDQFKIADRLKSINLCRDLVRNSPYAAALVNTIKTTAVGEDGGTLRFNSGDIELDKAVGNFWRAWMKDCDARGSLNFKEMLQLVIASVLICGDGLVVFDDFRNDDGKLFFFEGDQITDLATGDFKDFDDKGYTQIQGVIIDEMGRNYGYVGTASYGKTTVDIKGGATIFETAQAKLFYRPFRLNQKRGVPGLMQAASDLLDLYEMKSKELQTAKTIAEMAGVVKSENPISDALMRAGSNPDAILAAMTASDEPAATSSVNYEQLETITGGRIEYLKTGDSFELLNTARPGMPWVQAIEKLQLSAALSLGLSASYAMLTPSPNFRGDIMLSWTACFQPWQKWLERNVCDWVGIKALEYGQRKGLIPKLPEGWQNMLSWQWPTMPSADPNTDWTALNNGIKNGYIGYSDIFGADWESRLSGYGEQVKKASKYLPLSAFETVAGAPLRDKVPGPNAKPGTDNNMNNKNTEEEADNA